MCGWKKTYISDIHYTCTLLHTCTLAIYIYLNYFSNLRTLKESEKILDCGMEAYINHLDKLREGFGIRFVDLDNVHVPDWLVTPFYILLLIKHIHPIF